MLNIQINKYTFCLLFKIFKENLRTKLNQKKRKLLI